jgi:hypothetical protein
MRAAFAKRIETSMSKSGILTLPNDGVTGDFDENFMNLIVPQSAITNTLVDGSPIASINFLQIGTSYYSEHGLRWRIAACIP